MAGDPVVFDADAARRIAAQTIRGELTPRRSTVRTAKPGANWNPGIVRAKVSTAIPSGTFDSPSSAGRAQIYHKNAAGAWVASGDPVKVFNDNPLTAALPVNRTIKLGWIAGDWWLVSASCS